MNDRQDPAARAFWLKHFRLSEEEAVALGLLPPPVCPDNEEEED